MHLHQIADGTEDWIVYHAMRYSDGGWGQRYPFVEKFTWNADGTPNFGKGAGWGESLLLPSERPFENTRIRNTN